MTIQRIANGLARANRIAFTALFALALLFALSIGAGLRVPLGSAAGATQHRFAAEDWTAHNAVEASVVDQTIRGKAVFRTMRAVEEKVVDELGRYRLIGISVGSGEGRAYVKDTALKKTLSVSPGERLGVQFEVVEIRSDGIVLQRNGETFQLKRK